MSEPLDALTLPLHGSRLIEASAGTGKTWTIAALYLRLVLGHGASGPSPIPPLPPAEILVMTFTRAATRELAGRIRERLLQAAACFRGETPPGDAFLAALLAAYGDDDARRGAAWRLAAAAEAMDDAAVHTIDAWCQRMLREHAFDSGCLFDEELQPDPAALLAEAARDYWRQQVYPLAGAPLEAVLALWPEVDRLQASVAELLELPLPAGAGAGTLGQAVAHADAQRAAALAALKQGWAARADTMQAWLDAQTARADGPFHKTKLKPSNYQGWIARLRDWALDAAAVDPGLTDAARARLTPAGLRDAAKADAVFDAPPCFAEFAQLMAALPALPALAPALRLHAAARVAERLQQLKAQAGRFGFADLLQRLDDALDEARHGERARRLRERIVAQYPAALIDEFQDTSPLQLRIFDRLYCIADDDPARVLLLIGDPKQAIYGFRGADILSYLRARRATVGRHHVLGTNHRSTAALVDAVNACFGTAEARGGAGAFLYGGELPFERVAAQGRPERLVAGGAGVAPLHVALDAELRSAGDSREILAALCAEHIVSRLNDPGAGFECPGKPLQRLRPADIAVLVRSGREAAAVRRALRRRGVASVYLSDKDSVFASEQARDLLRLLQAVASPRDMRLARAALATPLAGARLDELLALADDDERFDAQCEALAQWRAVWQAQGVLAMLRRALHALGLPARWLGGEADDGERRLTNLLHLAELLQAESARLDGEQALIRWLARQAEAAAGGAAAAAAADEQVLRLESDADRVQVVTVHKSKGLEYPLVYLPFAAAVRPVERRRTSHLLPADADGRRTLVLAPSDAQLAAADHERQREDLRLLYVALTRARHALWLGVAALKNGQRAGGSWHLSALGHLLSGGASRDPAALGADVRALAAADPGIEVDTLSLPPDVDDALARLPLTRLRPQEALPALAPTPAYTAGFDRSWSISSYSALVRDLGQSQGHPAAPAPPAEPSARWQRDDEPDAGAGIAPGADDRPWHRFPRGAIAGNFLHAQLEWLAGEGFALEGSPALQAALRRRCQRQGWGRHADDVVEWLRRVCAAPLPAFGPAPGRALSDLRLTLPEMEFWLPTAGLPARHVDALCRAHVLPGRPRPALGERTLRGMLMGFADLVYEHDGRYGVLDHKSNALGARDADYTPEAMADAMLLHRYDVQAALYLLALQRLLRRRLGAAYDGRRHLHGAVYLFLRGVGHAPAGHGGWHLAPPLALLDALDALLAPAGADT